MFCGTAPFLSDDMSELKQLIQCAKFSEGPLDAAPEDLRVFVRALIVQVSDGLDWRAVRAAPFLHGELNDEPDCSAAEAHAAVVTKENASAVAKTLATDESEVSGKPTTRKPRRSQLPRPLGGTQPTQKRTTSNPQENKNQGLVVPTLEDSRPRTAESVAPTKPRTPLGNTYTVADMAVLDSPPSRRRKFESQKAALSELPEHDSPDSAAGSPSRARSRVKSRASPRGSPAERRRSFGAGGSSSPKTSPGTSRRRMKQDVSGPSQVSVCVCSPDSRSGHTLVCCRSVILN